MSNSLKLYKSLYKLCNVLEIPALYLCTRLKKLNQNTMSYFISKQINTDFNQAVEYITESLKAEGFGVITEIDMQEKLKDKLNVDFRKYKILGACNPAFAYKALQQEDKIGTLLPCSIIVQELAQNEIEIAAVDPVTSMIPAEKSELLPIAHEIKEKLTFVISSL